MNPTDAKSHNHLFANLPTDIWLTWKEFIEPMHLTAGEVLFETGMRRNYVYFPYTAIFSLTNTLTNGETIEVATIGKEGFIGGATFIESNLSSTRFVTLHSGLAYRLNRTVFKTTLDTSTCFAQLILAYTQSLVSQMSQVTACSKHHSLNQQVSRWLLLYSDRTNSNLMECTQEEMSHIFGTRRERISQVAKSLKDIGLISYSRGVIEIQDKQKLRALTCECYENMYEQSQRSSYGTFLLS